MKSRAFRVVMIAAAVAMAGCPSRKKQETSAVITPEPSVSAIPSSVVPDASPSDAKHVDSTPLPPAPKVPSIACTPDPRLRWAKAEEDQQVAVSGPDGFACSPFKTGSSPLELTIAPGTILRVPLSVEVSKDPSAGDAGDFESSYDVTYTSAGLPKGAWVDPDDGALKWHVAGAQDEAFAFSVAGNVTLPEGKRCVTASIVVRVHDDDSTRQAQAQWLNRDASVGHVIGALYWTGPSPEYTEFLGKVQCGDLAVEPVWRDADGDGLTDALFEYPPRGGGFPREVDVWLRRGETFAMVGTATGSVWSTADGTTFVVDGTSAGTGYSCSIGVKVFQVFKNRASVVFEERTNAILDDDTQSCNGGGMDVDTKGGLLLGFTDVGKTPTGVVTKRTWRWNGKKFALVP